MAKRSSDNQEGGGRVSLSGLPLQSLQREIQRRQGRVGGLIRRRDRMLAKVARMDASIRELGGAASSAGGGRRGRRGRGKAGTGLAQSLHAVMQGKTMGVNDAAAAVLKSGYQSNAANFRVMVNAALLKHKEMFKRVSRGQYTAV